MQTAGSRPDRSMGTGTPAKTMTAAEHRQEAARLLAVYVTPWITRWAGDSTPPMAISTPVKVALAAAQVHATMALSAGEQTPASGYDAAPALADLLALAENLPSTGIVARDVLRNLGLDEGADCDDIAQALRAAFATGQ